MKTKTYLSRFDLAALLNRAAAAIETPKDLTAAELRHVVEDLNAQADALDPAASQSTTPRASGNDAHLFQFPLEVTGFKEGDFGVCGANAGDTYFSGLTREQAAFIVTACNNHARLLTRVEELEKSLAALLSIHDDPHHITDSRVIDQARATLAKK